MLSEVWTVFFKLTNFSLMAISTTADCMQAWYML